MSKLGIKPSTSQERKQIFLESVFNTSDLVSKVSDHSVLAAIGSGVGKVAGKAEKDIVVALSKLFPDVAYGNQLDQVAFNLGIATRFGALSSSVYIRLIGAPSTNYIAGTHSFYSTSGVRFELESNVTIPAFGYIYAKVYSVTTGASSNVPPLTISRISPQPVGHKAVLNEVAAYGGRDSEDDKLFRERIKNGPNILARGTLAMLEQAFMKINSNVLRVIFQGSSLDGKLILGVATQNGVDLSLSELSDLLVKTESFLSLTEQRPFGSQVYGLMLQNIAWHPIDVSFSVELDPSYDPDITRITIQTNMLKYLNHCYWDSSKQKVEWDNLLQIVKNTRGIKYVQDQQFYPREDIVVPINKLPRLRGFLMTDLDNNIISNFSGTLLPIYYPNNPDFSYQATLLNNI